MRGKHQVGEAFTFAAYALNLAFVAINIKQSSQVVVVDSVFRIFDCLESSLVTFDVALACHCYSTMYFVERVRNIIGQIICNRDEVDRISELFQHTILRDVDEFWMRLLAVGTTVVIVSAFLTCRLDRFKFWIIGYAATTLAFKPIGEQCHLLIQSLAFFLEGIVHTFKQIRRHDELVFTIVPIIPPTELAAVKFAFQDLFNRTLLSETVAKICWQGWRFENFHPNGIVT